MKTFCGRTAFGTPIVLCLISSDSRNVGSSNKCNISCCNCRLIEIGLFTHSSSRSESIKATTPKDTLTSDNGLQFKSSGTPTQARPAIRLVDLYGQGD